MKLHWRPEGFPLQVGLNYYWSFKGQWSIQFHYVRKIGEKTFCDRFFRFAVWMFGTRGRYFKPHADLFIRREWTDA